MKVLSGLPERRRLFRATAGIQLSPIKEMELRAAQIPGVVSLAQGIPSFDTPEPIRAYVQEKIASGEVSRYSLTPGLPKLREAIAETLLGEGMRYDPESEIIVTCGAIEAIAATLLAALEPGDEVILPSPTYASYPEVIRMAGGVPRYVPLLEEENFALDPDALEGAVHRRTKAILLCNPNNPTGTIYTRAQIERLAALAARHDLLLVTDEVYKDFLYTHDELFTAARIDDCRRSVVRIFSFSKAYGMTGWRVGFLHSDRQNVAEILKVHDSLVTCAPVVSQYAALAALELGDEPIEAFRQEFRERRNRTLGSLDRLSHIFDYQKPNASYFVFPRVKDSVPSARDSRTLARQILERAKVAVVPGVAFGPTGEAHLRISYSRRREEIDEAFARLTDYFHAPRQALGARPVTALPADARTAERQRRTSLARRSTVAALNLLSRFYLARVRPRTIAIAGLQGKTVMKRSLREMFQGSLRVRANPRSYNTEIGLPFAILDTPIDTNTVPRAVLSLARAAGRGLFAAAPLDLLILEMGLRSPGDAMALLRAVIPNVLVLTPLAPSFTSDLSFLETLEQEISILAAEVSRRGGSVVACRDDPRIGAAVERLPRVRWFGRDQVREERGGAVLAVEGREYALAIEAVSDSAFYALLAGVEVARLLGVPDAEVAAFLERGATSPGTAGDASRGSPPPLP